MKTKTVRLSDDYRLNNGVVEQFVRTKMEEYDYETDRLISDCEYDWVPSENYVVGNTAMLVSHCNVSPNAIREGRSIDSYSLVFNRPDGIGGNTNPNIKRYHGWRGTTNDISCYALGLHEIVKIRALKNGQVAVTVGPDLRPDED